MYSGYTKYFSLVTNTINICIIKQIQHIFNTDKFNLRKLNLAEGKQQNYVKISNRFALLENLDNEVEMNSSWETNRENIKISATQSYYDFKTHNILMVRKIILKIIRSNKRNQISVFTRSK
jgi:hypothetical protein